MAVAPLNKVRQVVEYAVTEIPAEKISLGVPNYGYDWPLPFVQGVTRAKTIGNIEAIRIAIRYGVEIQFDETAKSPFFYYTDEMGVDHEVWFEDVRSLREKFNLIDEFGLRGPGYWQIMQLFRANWLLLDQRFQIKKLQEMVSLDKFSRNNSEQGCQSYFRGDEMKREEADRSKKLNEEFNSITQKVKPENQNQTHNVRKEGIASINRKR